MTTSLAGLSFELASSGRSKCKICLKEIQRSSPRVKQEQQRADWVQSAFFHPSCFNFPSHSVNTAADLGRIAGFSSLPPDAQALVAACTASPSSGKRPADEQQATAAAGPAVVGAKRVGATTSPSGSGDAKRPKKLPTQLEEEMPLALGVAKIEYAKAKKPSPCMACKGAIKNGEPRVGNLMESPYHEGLMTRWMHLTCAKPHIKRLSQLDGWDRMGYDANLEIRQHTGELLSEAAENELKTTMEALENVQDVLCANLACDELIAALKLNGVSVSDLLIGPSHSSATGDSIAMAVILSDYLAHGTPEDCPVCGNSSLLFTAGRITCWGYVNGLSKCQYKARACQRFKFTLPAAWEGAEWFEELLKPAAGGHAGKGKGKKKSSKKAQAAARADSLQVAALTGGLDLTEVKPVKTVSPSMADAGFGEKAGKVPLRMKPELGSPVLNVHRGYEQTGKQRFASVLVDDDGVTVYNANLTQTDLKTGINRFYVVQLLQLSAPYNCFEIFCHWGKIGSLWEEEMYNKFRPTFQVYTFSDKMQAICEFKKWFSKKTSNSWDERHAFKTRPGMYGFVELSAATNNGAGSKSKAGTSGRAAGGPRQTSSVNQQVAGLVELLFDQDTILHSMEKADINLEEMPLGKVTCERVEMAREILGRVTALLQARPCKPGVGVQEGRIDDGLRKLLTRQIEVMVSVCVRDKDASLTKRLCREKLGLIFGEACVAAQKAYIVSETDRLTTECREMEESALATFAAGCRAVTPDEVASLEMGGDGELDDEARRKATQDLRIWESKIEAVSTEFWRCIPSTNACVLDGEAKVQARMEVLDMLADIALAQDMTATSKSIEDLVGELKCSICPLPREDATYRAIEQALLNTAEPAVDKGRLCGFLGGGGGVELLAAFALARDGENQTFARHSAVGGRQLLWHGTNIATAAAITATGLRIMGSGGRVGTGIYLADEAGKSGHYVRTSQDGTGVMFLAEAALGKMFEVTKETRDVHSLRAAPAGFNSVKAVGRSCPDPSVNGDVTLSLDGKDVKLATGKSVRVLPDKASSFSQNEFLVYDQTQVRLRYLLLVRVKDDAHRGMRPVVPQQQMTVQASVAHRPVNLQPSSLPALAAFVPQGMSEDDMVNAAIAASMCVQADPSVAARGGPGAANSTESDGHGACRQVIKIDSSGSED